MVQEWITRSDINLYGIFLPGNDIPDWFTCKNDGPAVSFQTTHIFRNWFTVCFVYSSCPDKMVDRDATNSFPLNLTVINYRNSTTRATIAYELPIAHDVEDHICLIHVAKRWFGLECGDQVKVIVDCGPRVNVKKTGVVDGSGIHYASTSNKDAIVVRDDGDAFMDQIAIESKRGLGDDKSYSSHGSFDDDREAKRFDLYSKISMLILIFLLILYIFILKLF